MRRRRSAAPHPTSAATCFHSGGCSGRVSSRDAASVGMGWRQPALWTMALWKRPRTRSGLTRCWQTDPPPADSPASGDVVRIAAEGRDVPLHPAKREPLVLEPQAAVERAVDALDGEETEDAHPVVRGDDDHPSLRREPVEAVEAPGSADEGAAVDPDQHRELRPGCGAGGRAHVEGQAVLGGAALGQVVPPRLRAGVAEVGRVANARPGRGRLGQGPAEVAHRRRGEGDPPELDRAVALDAPDGAPAPSPRRGAPASSRSHRR